MREAANSYLYLMELNFSTLIFILTSFILSLYIFFLLHKGRKKPSNFILALFFLSQILGVFPQVYYGHYDYFYTHYPQLFYVGLPSTLLWAPSLYLYVRSITDVNFWKRKILSIHLLPFLFLLFYFIFNYHIYDVETKRNLLQSSDIYDGKDYQLLGIAIFIQVVAYNTASLIEIHKYEKRLKQNISTLDLSSFKWLKFIVYCYVITCLINLTILKLIGIYTSYDHVALGNFLFFIFFTLLFYKALISPEVFVNVEAKPKYRYSNLDPSAIQSLLVKLDTFIVTNKPYLQPNLSLSDLAEHLEMSDRHLSQIVNEHKGQNFYDFINRLRIEEAKRLLADANNPHNILQILYEVGFNSKTAFNVTFKKFTGLTPTEYRKIKNNSN